MKEEKILEQKSEEINKKKKFILRNTILIIFLFNLLFYFYIRYIEPNLLKVNEYAIVDNQLPYSFHGIKIVQFSDILYGSNMKEIHIEKVVNKINNLKPDIVLFTGDLLNNTIKINDTTKKNLIEILSKINATYKKYAILGDNDFSDTNAYYEIMESANFMILNNKNDFLYYMGNDPLLFVGTSSLNEQEFNKEQALANPDDIQTAYKIWLHHEPAVFEELIATNYKPNLVFTGHSLNGLIKIPFYGPLLKQDGINSFTENYYEKNEVKMYISGGLGTYKYNVRFFNFPSINLYRLYQY